MTPARRRVIAGAAVAVVVVLAWWGIAVLRARWFTPPPSIFDTPVDDVAAYLALDDFSRLPLQERMDFLTSFADRFRGLSQGESAVLAGFLAGLGGPAREQILANARTLAKDILADGAQRYLALSSDAERAAFLDEWMVEWVRRAERLAEGPTPERSPADILGDASTEAREDAARTRRGISLEPEEARAFLDFWQREVETTATPREQGQIIRFMTDLRTHLLTR